MRVEKNKMVREDIKAKSYIITYYVIKEGDVYEERQIMEIVGFGKDQ